MWHLIARSGFASAGVDLTKSFSLLVASLVSLVWLSTGLIVVMAIQHYRSQTQIRLPEATSHSQDHQEAA
jgi:hypothetical protein